MTADLEQTVPDMEPYRYAITGVTGVHIGLWRDKATVEKIKPEYTNSIIELLYSAAQVEQLQRERDQARADKLTAEKYALILIEEKQNQAEKLEAAERQLAQAQVDRDAVLEVLKPIAAYTALRDEFDPDYPDDTIIIAYNEGFGRHDRSAHVTLGEFRAAAAIISKEIAARRSALQSKQNNGGGE